MRGPETRSRACPRLRPPVRLFKPHLRTLYEGGLSPFRGGLSLLCRLAGGPRDARAGDEKPGLSPPAVPACALRCGFSSHTGGRDVHL